MLQQHDLCKTWLQEGLSFPPFLPYLKKTLLLFFVACVSLLWPKLLNCKWSKTENRNVIKMYFPRLIHEFQTSVLNVHSVQPARTHWLSSAGAWSKLNPKCWQVSVSAELPAAIHPLGRCLPRAQCKCHVCVSRTAPPDHNAHCTPPCIIYIRLSLPMHLQSQGCKQEPTNRWVKGIKSWSPGTSEAGRAKQWSFFLWDLSSAETECVCRGTDTVFGIGSDVHTVCSQVSALLILCLFCLCTEKKNLTFWLNITTALCASQTIIYMLTANN